MTVDGADVTGGTAGTPSTLASGTVGFDATGQLNSVTIAAPGTGGGTLPAVTNLDVTFTSPTWTNGAAANTMTWDITDTNNVNSLTGFSAASATSSLRQNGATAGMVDNISILKDGTIQATFGAGQTVAVGQIGARQLQQPEGAHEAGLEQIRREPVVGQSERGHGRDRGAWARSSATPSSSRTWTSRRSSHR